MAAPRSLQFDTLSLHAGQRPDPVTGARATPIYFTTSFVFRDADHAAALFNMERGGHVYSRISNPTNAVLEERVAALEGGVGAIATASGQAALHLAIATIAGAGCAHRLLARALRRLAQSAVLHAAALRHRDDFRAPARPRRLAPRDPAEHAAAVRRDARQPGAGRARHPRGCRDRARRRAAAAGRLDLYHPLSAAAVRSRRRPRSPLGHQVPRRARRRDRRRAGGRRRLRLGGFREISGTDRTLRGLSRDGLLRRSPPSPRSSCARAARACATSAPA